MYYRIFENSIKITNKNNMHISAIIIKKNDFINEKVNLIFYDENIDEREQRIRIFEGVHPTKNKKLYKRTYKVKKLEQYYYKKIGKYYYFRIGVKPLRGDISIDANYCTVYFLVRYYDYDNIYQREQYRDKVSFNELSDFYKQLGLSKYSFLNLHKYFNAKTNPIYYIYICLKIFCEIDDITNLIWFLVYSTPLYYVEFNRPIVLSLSKIINNTNNNLFL